MFSLAHALTAAWHWLTRTIRPQRETTHHRREAKEQ
jgi:hypothetical protein